MPDTLMHGLEPVLAAWTIGGAAAGKAPLAWADAIGAGSEAELRLLALSGSLIDPFVLPVPQTMLTVLVDLPRLTLPALAEPLRPLSRRALRALAGHAGHARLAALLAGRGRVLHPGDWLPPAADTEPLHPVYAPWQDWVAAAGRTAGARAPADDALNAQTWGDYGRAARVGAFAVLRRADAAAARGLLAQRGAGEAAEHRARLVGVLAHGLSEADAPYLESLAADRAPRVQALAASLLARLGRATGTESAARELADLFPLATKGLIRRTRVLAPVPLKTPAQHNRRRELFQAVPAAAFAAALGLAAPDELAALWPLGADPRADADFAAMLAGSADDATVTAFAARVTAERDFDWTLAMALEPRLDAAARAAFVQAALTREGGSFARALSVAGAPGTLAGAIRTRAGEALIAAAAVDQASAMETNALGLLASGPAAQEAIARLTEAGMLASDPRLDVLRLNRATGTEGDVV